MDLCSVQFFTGQTFQEWVDVSFPGRLQERLQERLQAQRQVRNTPLPIACCIAVLCGHFTGV